MTRRLTPQTTLDNLKKEAKRWLKALRASETEARERLLRAWPAATEDPVLRDLQRALALEYGFSGWTALKQALENPALFVRVENTPELVAQFLEYACPDHHVRGRPAHRVARHAAMRLLQQHPEIVRENLYTAVVCGESDIAERILREHPELANAKAAPSGPNRSGAGGSYDFLGDMGGKDWEPLLSLCFTRLDLPKANDNAMTIARMLLDNGADPNVYFMAGHSRYTPLVGVIGEGEEDRPPHPRRDELVRLLLDRGAEPYDQQVNYNIHFHGKVLWWLKLMYEYSVKAGRLADWQDPDWRVFNMDRYGSGARWHLWIAVKNNDVELAQWCLEHGANPNAGPPDNEHLPQHGLFEQAVRLGHMEIAELLAQHGATSVPVTLEGEEEFVAACLRMDRGEVKRLLAQHPEYLQSPKATFAAAKLDRADVVELLLDVGTPIEVEDSKKQRALHVAAWENAVNVAELLIRRGAELDPYELNHNNTPLDFAVYAEHDRMVELLSPHSRDVWNLTFIGAVDRLREVLSANPELAKVSWQATPLFWLPEDEQKALEIGKLFLEHGADPAFRSLKDGMTAADVARRRGMHDVAALLDGAVGPAEAEKADRKDYLCDIFEQRARDLVTVYRADDLEALEQLGRHFNRILSFDDIRRSIRQGVKRLQNASAAQQLEIAEARDLIARQGGFAGWSAFIESLQPGASQPGAKEYENLTRHGGRVRRR